MPGLAPPAGPAFAPVPRAPDRPRPAPDRSVPPLDDLVAVPAGVYVLGEPGQERQITLVAFEIGRFPVTNAHFRAFAEQRGRPLTARLADAQLGDHPATEVTYQDAVEFCAWPEARRRTAPEGEPPPP